MTQEPTHPLEQSLNRLAELSDDFASDCGELEADWFLAWSLVDDPERLTAALVRAASEHEGLEPKTNATFFFGDYSWYVALPAIACYFIEGRVPDLEPDRLALNYRTVSYEHGDESGTYERLACRFLTKSFYCLPGDAHASHEDAQVVPDAEALREVLRVQLEANHMPLVEALAARTKIGKRALWNLAADSAAAIFLEVGEKVGQSERAQREGLAFIRADGSALKNSKTGYFTLTFEGHQETFRARGGCCRYYTLPEHVYCSTCVHRKPEERDATFLGYMAEKYAPDAGAGN